jgi:iron complex transport system ATP-binding protein
MVSVKLENVSLIYKLHEKLTLSAPDRRLGATGGRIEGSGRRQFVQALDGVSFELRAGDRLGLVGPNGAGKTTLLQVAATTLFPTRGTAEVLGEELGLVDVFELRPRIGLSSAAVASRLPGSERVLDVVVTAAYAVLGRWHERYDELDLARARELLGAFGVAHLAGRTFGTLSEGERKRVQIARALMADPEMMLLDEPAAGLDLGGREDLVRRLGDLAADEDAPALVLVTHHVEEVPPSFTHALLLKNGEPVAAGPIDEVLADGPLSETFGLPLAVERREGRFTARAR